MYEGKNIVSIIAAQGLKVRLSYRNYRNENGEITPYEEVKDVICLALLEETDPKYARQQSVHPMIFDEYIDFGESENTDIVDLYYADCEGAKP